MLCGYLYSGNFIIALAFAWSGMLIGIAASFICGRYLFREVFEKKFGNSSQVKILNEYIGSHPFLTSTLTRLFFIIPYNIQNYAYSCTIIKPFPYFVGTLWGILPITILNVALGYLIGTGGLENSAGATTVVSVVAVVLVIIAMVIVGKKILKKKMDNKNEVAENK